MRFASAHAPDQKMSTFGHRRFSKGASAISLMAAPTDAGNTEISYGKAKALRPELTITTYCLPLRPMKVIGLV